MLAGEWVLQRQTHGAAPTEWDWRDIQKGLRGSTDDKICFKHLEGSCTQNPCKWAHVGMDDSGVQKAIEKMVQAA